MRGDLLRERRVEDVQPVRFCLLLEKLTGPLDLLLIDLHYIIHSRSLQYFGRPEILGVLTAIRESDLSHFRLLLVRAVVADRGADGGAWESPPRDPDG